MDPSFSPVISSSMRPSKSLISQVKNTLSGLVSSVFKRKTSKSETRIESDAQENQCTNNTNDSRSSLTNGNSDSPLSKSQYLRSNEAFNKRLKSFTVITSVIFTNVDILITSRFAFVVTALVRKTVKS